MAKRKSNEIERMLRGFARQANAPKERELSQAERNRRDWDALKAEEARDFVPVETPLTEFEKLEFDPTGGRGLQTKTVLMPRAQYQKDFDKIHGITGGLRKVWGLSVDQIQAAVQNPLMRVEFHDDNARLPQTVDGQPVSMTDENIAQVTANGEAFFERHPELSGESRNKILVYVGLSSDSDSRVDVLDPRIWSIACERLLELGAISDERTLQPVQQPTKPKELSADEELKVANAAWFSMFESVWLDWLRSLKENFGFEPTREQQFAAVKMLERIGTDGPAWDRTRIALGRTGVFPKLLTSDDLLVEAMDGMDLSTPQGRERFHRAKNQTLYSTIDQNVVLED